MIIFKTKHIYQITIILSNLILFIKCLSNTSSQLSTELKAISEVIERMKRDPMDIISELRSFIDIITAKQRNTEDVSLNITELVTKYCCTIQEHQIVTDDDYLLTLFRMEGTGPPVFLMHGLYNSADDWVTAGPNDALAYILYAAGYDVWLGNARGNKYSRQHLRLTPDEAEFWQFSWDEIGNYDLPAMIDYVLSATNRTQLSYIGHSQGTTSFFVLCSDQPDYNNKISTMIALSPLAWMGHVPSILLKTAAPFILKNSWVFQLLNYNNFNPGLGTSICNIGNGIVCLTALFSVFGFDYEQVNRTNSLSFLGHIMAGGSLNQMLHYLQSVQSKSFQKFDYGPDKNEEIYGCIKPPAYPVEKVTVPTALLYADNDLMVNMSDLLILKNKLQNVITFYRVPFRKFNHIDFMYAKDVKRLVYSKVLQILALIR